MVPSFEKGDGERRHCTLCLNKSGKTDPAKAFLMVISFQVNSKQGPKSKSKMKSQLHSRAGQKQLLAWLA
jgi:hypothetical protein